MHIQPMAHNQVHYNHLARLGADPGVSQHTVNMRQGLTSMAGACHALLACMQVICLTGKRKKSFVSWPFLKKLGRNFIALWRRTDTFWY